MTVINYLYLQNIIEHEYLSHLMANADSDLLIIDTRSFSSYSDGHIPRSINIDLMHFHWIDTSTEGLNQFNKQMKILLNYLGIDYTKKVVFYDDISGPSASRGVWLLDYFSHRNCYILNGGFENWFKSNKPIEKLTNTFKHSISSFHNDYRVISPLSYIKNKVKDQDKDVVILDCRSKQEYDGDVARAFNRGHIPNAKNIDWKNNIENGKFKDLKDLENLYSSIPKDKEVITYCHGGYRAANTYIVLKHLGYSKVKMYLGSWGEWGNIPTLPIE